MKQTTTIKALAAASGKHETTIRRTLKKNGAPFIWRHGRGGSEKHFFIVQLSRKLRLALAGRHVGNTKGGKSPAAAAGSAAAKELLTETAEKEELARIAKEEGLAAFERLSNKHKAEAKARFFFLQACDEFVDALGTKTRKYAKRSKKADLQFVQEYNAGRVNLEESITSIIGETTSYSTLRRLFGNYERYGLAGLANGYNNPKKGCTSLTEEMQKFLLGLIYEKPHIKTTAIEMCMEPRFASMPSVGVIRRFVAFWKKTNAGLMLWITNPDKWRNERQFALGDASEQVIRLNQVWEFDSTPADVMLADGRYCLIGVIDVYSRRLKLLVSKTSRSTAVAALTRRAILDWGIPEIAKTDNGADYVSNHIVQVFSGLEIEQLLCPPFTPECKPFIERAFKTFAHSFLEMMPNYIGHSVADRKDIEARRSFASRIMGKDNVVEIKMTAEELQTHCDRWCRAIYHQNKHRGLDNKTPAQVAQSWKHTVKAVSNKRALDILLAEAPQGGTRTVTKKGVKVGRIHYISDALPEPKTVVKIKLDPTDLGTIYLFNEDGKFICVAQDPARTGIDRTETAAKLKNRHKKLVREGQKELKRNAREQALDDINEEILAHRESKIANIIELPKRTEEHRTTGLDEAAQAVLAADTENAIAPSTNHLNIDTFEPVALKKTSKKSKIVLIQTDSDRYDLIRSNVKADKRKLTKAEHDFLTRFYKETSPGQTYLALEGDFREIYGLEERQQAEL